MRAPSQKGFTLIELMVSLTVLIVGLLGLLGIVMVAMRASAYSRHGTEAAVIAEDRMEELRTATVSDTADAEVNDGWFDLNGVQVPMGDPTAFYERRLRTRFYNDVTLGDLIEVEVIVRWDETEQGSSAATTTRQVQLYTQRYQ